MSQLPRVSLLERSGGEHCYKPKAAGRGAIVKTVRSPGSECMLTIQRDNKPKLEMASSYLMRG